MIILGVLEALRLSAALAMEQLLKQTTAECFSSTIGTLYQDPHDKNQSFHWGRTESRQEEMGIFVSSNVQTLQLLS